MGEWKYKADLADGCISYLNNFTTMKCYPPPPPPNFPVKKNWTKESHGTLLKETPHRLKHPGCKTACWPGNFSRQALPDAFRLTYISRIVARSSFSVFFFKFLFFSFSFLLAKARNIAGVSQSKSCWRNDVLLLGRRKICLHRNATTVSRFGLAVRR